MIKKYILKALKFYLLYVIFFCGFDAIFLQLKPLEVYATSGLFFTAFVLIFNYLDDKGWNSWKRVGNLFLKKNNKQM